MVDGIHDDLLTHIARIGSIRTISRTSVLRYRDSTLPIPEIAGQLGVTTSLEGGVQRAGDQIHIDVQYDSSALEALATIRHMVFNRHEEAVRRYAEVIILNPEFTQYYIWFAHVYFVLGNPERARALVQRSLELAPEAETASRGEVLLYLDSGDFEKVVAPAAETAAIRGAPEFQRVVDQIESDMSAQMQRVREMEESGEIPTVPGVSFLSG